MKPNIFDIATKELSQDAFITWLLQYADDNYISSDELLCNCGKSFVTELIKKQLPDFNESVKKVEAGRQWENIDVWATVNGKYLIIIEDKTFTSYHSDQLERYRSTAMEWCKANMYEEPICVYLKTGNESLKSLQGANDSGFSVFDRKDFIKLLQDFKGINNNIFIDFLERLNRLETSNNEFRDKAIGTWKSADWQGFYQCLEGELDIIDWSYVNNATGGFWNAVLNWEEWEGYAVYIQLEQDKLCYKISVHEDDGIAIPEGETISSVRKKFHRFIVARAKETGMYTIRRPDRFGHGKYMTVALVDKENWLGKDDDTLDIVAVVNTLKGHMNFLNKAINDK